MISEAILNPPIVSYGSACIDEPTTDQFKKYIYPIPKEEGGSEIHMMWTDSPCRLTCWNDGMRTVESFKEILRLNALLPNINGLKMIAFLLTYCYQ